MSMDVIHYFRASLKFHAFEKVINLFISYFADRTLGLQLHIGLLRTMSTSLSENLIAVARQEEKLEEGRLIFMRVLTVLSLRLKVMVKYSLPLYKTK